jgi:calcineurin-like phosphoesterase family protein
MIWFCSDHHFGHANIVKLCNRPYDDVIQMEKDLVLRHNAVVRPGEVVYFIGDIVWDKRSMDILPSLHGVHRFVLGGHDLKFFAARTPGALIPGVRKYEIWEVDIEGQPLVLCHFPLREWNRSHYGAWHLHGHCHGRGAEPRNCLDVSVDAWDFYPVSLTQIREKIDPPGARLLADIHARSDFDAKSFTNN